MSNSGLTDSSQSNMAPITLAITGASGAVYGLRLLELLLTAGRRVYFLISKPGLLVVNMETRLKLPAKVQEIEKVLTETYSAAPGQVRVFGDQQWTAPVASGSSVSDAMVICPCTMGTLASIAAGLSSSLLERAADVILKEQKKLILVPRETPLSSLHLENMLKLSKAGVLILPPNPGFYDQQDTVSDLVDFVVARILDHLGITHKLIKRWG